MNHLFRRTRRTIAALAVASSLSISFGPAFAQAACAPTVTPITKNCTSSACVFEACWAAVDPSLTGCKLYITTPSGALPAISGSMTTAGAVCTVTAPTLITGTHTITASGVNAFGEGAKMSPPLVLTTGAPPAGPSGLAAK